MAGRNDLLSLDEALCLSPRETATYHQRHLNPRMPALLELVGFTTRFTRAAGAYLWDENGTRYTDFLCGYGALSLGHNHPHICAALNKIEAMPSLVEGLDPLAAALAHNLAAVAPGALTRVYFSNSGAEAVDAALKLARAATGRTTLVACCKGFHGRTIGALSMMDRVEYSEPFQPLLPDVSFVPFGDLTALEESLRGHDVAAFLVEPMQGEAGFIVPPRGYLASVRDLCTRYGTLFIADEVQTGLGRTGTLFAVNHDGIVPDVLLLGKALGGGLMPLSAVLTTDDIAHAAKVGTARSPFHMSTFGGNARSCAAGIAALEVIVGEDLASQAAAAGDYLMQRLRELQSRQPLIAQIRGRGLMVGVVLAAATHGMATYLTAGLVNRLAREYFTGEIMTRLVRQHRIITAFTLNDSNVLRLQPPLDISTADLDAVVEALDDVLRDCGSFVQLALRSKSRLIQALRA